MLERYYLLLRDTYSATETNTTVDPLSRTKKKKRIKLSDPFAPFL